MTNETDNMTVGLGLPESQLTKQEIWERKLLDFTLRNNLLNTRLGRRVVPFMSFAIDHLEDHLQEGEDYSIIPCPDTKVEPGEDGMYDSRLHATLYHEQMAVAMANRQLVSYLTETELQNALKYIHRAARTSIEENGANSLFLALGMLKWYDREHPLQPHYAPLLLLPVNIVRKGAGKYVIRKRDEDIMLNITLAELLKQDYGIGLDQLKVLSKDQSGVDVRLVFETIRQAVAEEKGWTVVEEALLGLFSFSKFVMWNDIHSNAARLHEHPIIASLMDGVNRIPPATDILDARVIDRNNAPLDFAIPMDVDSSQMEAVVESGRGRSFILHGPPGTGKSQTITNMIANALYQGRRVLFVAEKMAALSVVQSRLTKLGLDPFCLELHSNKATKKHFLEQMERVLAIAKTKSPTGYQKTSDELFDERRELIAYMDALHRQQDCGLSLYNCITEYLSVSEEELSANLPIGSINAQYIAQCTDQADKLKAVVGLVGQPARHPLAGLEPIDNSQQTFDALKQLLVNFRTAHEAYRQALTDVNQNTPFKMSSANDIQWLGRLAKELEQLPVLNRTLLDVADDQSLLATLDDAVVKGSRCHGLRSELTSRFSENLLSIDVDDLLQQWNKTEQSWFLPKLLGRRRIVKELQAYGTIQTAEVGGVLTKVKTYHSLSAEVDSLRPRLEQLFGSLALRDHEQWNTMHTDLTVMPRLATLLSEYAATHQERFGEVAGRLATFADSNPWNVGRQDYLDRISLLQQTFEQVATVSGQINGKVITPLSANILAQQADGWLGCYDTHIRDWYHWGNMKRQLHSLSMDMVTQRIEKGEEPQTAVNRFVKGLYHQLINALIDKNPQLRAFNGLLFQQKIEKYQQNTARFQELSKKELFCRLAARVSSVGATDEESSELGKLKRNIASGGRGSSIRSVIDAMPHLLPQLCPCMLMSPISVAQYIDLNAPKFDLVIFDEASQMPTSEAVGAIARGKTLIVVGDSKQMPPTSFFSSSQTDEEEAYIDDMESILEDCKTLSMQEHYLSWHYRSKHESLIAFSNSQYYDNKLFTFPSVDDKLTKVSFVKIEGAYDKGHSRSNPEEAKAIVDEVMRRLKDPQLSQFSIGIVSFSKVQQNLIEDLLTDELDRHHELKEAATGGEEPVFVKNLENVQGDERDVILFSVGYGPDKDGHVSMNFGPLNNAGGERRLNVAVSRARYEMMVFSSMTASQIDLRRSSAKGVEGLKHFLEYAADGHLPQDTTAAVAGKKDIIVSQICQALNDQGYLTTTNVGRSNFKVDIAVSSPQDPDNYLLGIMCDGKGYYRTKTTRDREIVQPAILQMLHWQTMRVYSIDWYANRDNVISRILKKLKEI